MSRYRFISTLASLALIANGMNAFLKLAGCTTVPVSVFPAVCSALVLAILLVTWRRA